MGNELSIPEQGAPEGTLQERAPAPGRQNAASNKKIDTAAHVVATHRLLDGAVCEGTARLEYLIKNSVQLNERLSNTIAGQIDSIERAKAADAVLHELHISVRTMREQLDGMQNQLDRLVQHASDEDKRRQRLVSALGEGEKTTLRRKLGDPNIPMEKQFSSLALAKQAEKK